VALLLALAASSHAAALDLATGVNVHMRIDGAAAGDSIIGPRDLGDVNGDGRSDILVRSNIADPAGRTDAGAAWVVFGSATPKTVDLASLGTDGFQIIGAAAGDNFGQTGLKMGDVNGDGLADIAIGARNADNNGRTSSGSVYVIFGKSSTTTVDTASLGSGGYRIDGAGADQWFGSRIGTGDVNGDGLTDVIAGASGTDFNGRAESGSVYVVFGKASTSDIDVSVLGSWGRRIDGAIANDQVGLSLPGGVDVNNDGNDDVIVAAGNADPSGRTNAGSAWVIFGGTSTSTIDLAAPPGGYGFRIDGATAGDRLGNIGPLGDINDDAFDDFAITAASADYNGRTNSGSLFVIHGGTSTADIDLASGYNGFRIDGAAAEDGLSFGWAAGDIDGDNYPDILLGASGADNNGRTDSGASYVVFGSSSGANIDLNTAGTNVVRIDGAAAYDYLGTSLSTIADLGGDGYPELMLTAQGDDRNGRADSGSFYVVGFTEALPTAETDGVTAVTGTGATLQGTANPNGRPASSQFQWGPSPLLGNTTASVSAGSGTADVAATAAISGLQPNTTYYYRLRVTDADGYVRYGRFRTFTTDTTAPTDPTVSGGSLSWQSVASVAVTGSGATDAPPGLIGQYFNNTALSGAPALQRTENVNFDWGTGSPGPGVNTDSFSSRWTGVLVVPATGDYRFRTSSDDGVRLWVDGSRVVNNWTSHPTTVDTSTYISLTGGERVAITLEHYENTGSADVSLQWETPSTPSSFTAIPASAFEPVGAGLTGYEHRTSTDGGSTWSSASSGTTATVTSEGETLVQFRSVDGYGNRSGWVPASAAAGSTARIDRTAPTDPTVAGGNLGWTQSPATVTITGGSSTDALSGPATYQQRTSTNGGTTWSSPTAGASVGITATGETLVQYRSVDGAGNTSTWTPTHSPTPTDVGTVRITTQIGVDLAVAANVHLRVDGQAAGDNLGEMGIFGAGDVNGDGRADLVVGAPYADNNTRSNSGSVYVVFGQATATTVDLAALGGNGFRVDGPAAGAVAGYGAGPAGDVNGDGLMDILVGAHGATFNARSGSGAAYVVFGTASTATIDTATPGAWGYRIEGATASESAGVRVANGGDVNGDGRADALISARLADNNGRTDSGSVYVVFGKASTTTIDLAALGTGGYRMDGTGAGDWFGNWVANAGDVNGDGRTDSLIGSRLADGPNGVDAGAAHVVFGKTDATTVDTAALGSGGYRIDGAVAGDNLGWRVSDAGDVNGDGTPDQIVSAPWADNNGRQGSGSVYVLWGKAGTGTIDLASLGSGGYRIDGTAALDDIGGGAVASVQDINGDGRPEQIVAARGQGVRGRAASGAVYMVYGSSSTATVDLRSATSRILRFDGAAANDGAGGGAGSIADLTGDGRPEILVSAWKTDPAGRTDAGSAYAVPLSVTTPSATTTAVTGLTSGVATLNGTVNPNGYATTWYVEWGATTAYGNQTAPVALGSGSAPVAVSHGLTGLTWGQTINYRVVATNEFDYTTYGANQVFTAVDTDAPSAPTSVSGGSASWQSVASVTVTATGGSDTGTSGFAGHQYRTSTDGGTTWGAATSGSSVTVTAQGETLVQFRSIDNAGNTSAWTPSHTGGVTAAAAVRIDRTAPSAPTVSGGSASWQSVASVTVTGSGAIDTGGSTLSGYQYRTSTDGGTTWGTATSGASLAVTAEGQTLVQIRAVDVAGNASAWTPAHSGGPTAAATVRIDRTAPSAPTVSGGSLSWQSAASVTVTAASSTDAGGSALSGYQYRTSTDAGVTWSATPVTASSLAVTAEGETLVQFRSTDGAGNASAWTPASSGASNTVRLDRTGPSAPTVAGGSLSWQNVASVTVTGSGSTDTHTAVAGYQYRTSTDGGTTWGAATSGASITVSAEGETLVQFRAIDTPGNAGPWAPSSPAAGNTVRINRTGPTAPTVAGGSLSWQTAASVTVTGSGATVPNGTITGYEYRTSTDGGTTWSAATAGSSVTVSAQGETLVQFRAIDDAANTGPWGPSSPAAGSTVRLDRTNPTAPTASGGSSSWQSVASITLSATGATDAHGGIASHEYRTSTDGGTTWSAPAAGAMVIASAEGETLAQFRALDAAGNTSGWSATGTARIDRTTPTAPTVAGGSLTWQSVASVAVTASGATDGGSGLSGYEHRTSTDNGTTWSTPSAGASVSITAEGQTLVQYRSADAAGNTSAWTPAYTGGPTAAGTVRIDRTAPTGMSVTGGSNTWFNAASGAVSGAGAVDALSGVAGYEYRTSTDGGTTWGTATSGATATITAEGDTIVQFRATDAAGNAQSWFPVARSAASTVRLDRAAPTTDSVTGGSLSWQDVASVTVTGSGATDAGSGIDRHEYRTSTDGGTTWGSATTGTSVAISAEGETLVQFRAVDVAGTAGAWAPAAGTAGATVRIDRTTPTAPTVAGGSLTWQNIASLTVTASGSTDAGGSTLTGYEHRTSTDGGTTWGTATAGASVTVSAEGETLVQFRALDGAGHATAWTPVTATAGSTVRLDRTAPVAPSVSGGSASWQSIASVTLSATGATDAHGGVSAQEYRTSTDGGATWSAPAAGGMLIVSAEGETLAQFRAIDAAGNTSGWSGSGIARIDRTNPTLPIATGGSTAWQSVVSVTLSAAGATDAGGSALTGYRYRTSTDGGATWSAPAAGSSMVVTAEGETLVQFSSVDGAGNTSAWTASQTARIDRTTPTAPSVSGGDTTWRNAASTVLTASGSTDAGGATLTGHEFRTSTDGGGTWSAAAAGASLTVTAEGETLVQFRSLDGAGNTSAWTASATSRLDRTAPTAPTVAGGSLTWQSTASVTVTASGSTDAGGSTLTGYERRTSTDGGTSWGAASTGSSVTVTAEGETLVQFRSVDGAGSTSAWTPASAIAASTVRIDRTDPVAPTGVSAPAATSADPVITWNAVAGAVSYIVTRDGVQIGTPTGTTFTDTGVPGEGTYVYRVIAVDQAGNQSPPSAPATVVRDTTTPDAPGIATGSDGSLNWRNVASITIAVDPTAGATTEYRTSTDGGTTWNTPTTGASVTVTAEGETLVQFRTVDGASNASAWIPAHSGGPAGAGTARIDRTDPATPANVSAPAATNADPVITWDPVGDALSYIVTRDGVQIGTPAGTTFTDTTTPGDGTHVYRVIAVDRAGNQSAPGGPVSVLLDTVDPAAPSVAAGSEGSLAWRDVPSVTIAVDPTPGATTQYRTSTDGGTTWTTPATGTTVTITTEGETLVQFRTEDTAGNTSSWTPSVAGGPVAAGTARIDRTDPAVPANVTAPAATNTDPVISWDPASGANSYIVTRDGVQIGTTSGTTFTDTAAPGEGTYVYRVIAVDAAANQSAPSSPVSVTLDTTDPAAPSVAAGSDGSLAWRDVPSVTITVDPTPGATTQYRTSTDGGITWTTPVTGTTVTVTDEGETLVQFRTVDAAGNTSSWTPSVAGGPVAAGTARIDRTDPAAPGGVSAPAATNTDPVITWSAVAGATSYIVTRDGVQIGTTSGTTFTDTTAPGEGTYVYRVIAVDQAANQSAPSSPVSVTLDTTIPTAPSPAAGSEGSLTWRDVPSVTIEVDPTAGATTQYRTSTDGGITWTTPATGTSVTITDEGETLVQFRTVDPAGNTSAWTPSVAGGPVAAGTARIDRTPPPAITAADVTGGSLSWTNAASVTITGTPPAGTTLEYRTSTDGAVTWSAPAAGSSVVVTAEGETLVQYRVIDSAGNASAWGPAATPPTAGATARIDRTAPPLPTITATADATVALASRTGRVNLVTGGTGDTERVVVTEASRVVVDGPAGASTTYGYEAVAVDRAGNRSAVVTADVTTPDRTPPDQPTAPNGAGYPMGLSWTGVADAAGYEISRDSTVAGTSAGLTLTDPGAVDAAAPPAPTGVTAAASGPGRAAVDWTAVTDNGTPYAFTVRALDAAGNASSYSPSSTFTARSGIARYRVMVNGTQVAETTTLAVDLEGLAGDVPHTITIVALDRAGNASAPSAPIVITVPAAASTGPTSGPATWCA